MKKGISLIVLVITIIVMIIIAGAIIISLNSTSVIEKANTAVIKSDVGTINDKLSIAYIDVKLDNQGVPSFTASTTVKVGDYNGSLQGYYEQAVPEIQDLSSYEGYAFAIFSNGSAQVVETGIYGE